MIYELQGRGILCQSKVIGIDMFLQAGNKTREEQYQKYHTKKYRTRKRFNLESTANKETTLEGKKKSETSMRNTDSAFKSQ